MCYANAKATNYENALQLYRKEWEFVLDNKRNTVSWIRLKPIKELSLERKMSLWNNKGVTKAKLPLIRMPNCWNYERSLIDEVKNLCAERLTQGNKKSACLFLGMCDPRTKKLPTRGSYVVPFSEDGNITIDELNKSIKDNIKTVIEATEGAEGNKHFRECLLRCFALYYSGVSEVEGKQEEVKQE